MVVDPAISRGGCYLETSLGAIDATLETQLDQIASLIWEKVEKAGLLATRLPQ
jgi:flagellar biosynthesis/type III secretory pathway protein FliH